MKRTLEKDLTLADLAQYAIMHQHITQASGDGTWIHDKKHALNTHLTVIPRKTFVFDAPLDPELLANLSFAVDDKPCGTFASPDAARVQELGTKATFGKGNKEVYDPKVRTALAIDGARLTFSMRDKGEMIRPNELFAHLLSWEYRRRFEAWCGADPERTVVYRLHVYPKGGKFDTHVDTPHGDTHIASAIVVLKSIFEGGALVIEHGGEEKRVFEPGTLAAWYTDCPHRVEEVTMGTRLVLQFDVCTNADKLPSEGEGSAESSEYSEASDGEMHPNFYNQDSALESPQWKAHLVQELRKELAKGNAVALLLEHAYYSTRQVPAPENLKGRDRLLWTTLAGETGFTMGLVAIVSQEIDPQEGRTERSIGPLTPLPSGGGKPAKTLFIPGPDAHLFEVIHKPGAELQGNSPMDGESTYLGVVIYCVQGTEEGEKDKD